MKKLLIEFNTHSQSQQQQKKSLEAGEVSSAVKECIVIFQRASDRFPALTLGGSHRYNSNSRGLGTFFWPSQETAFTYTYLMYAFMAKNVTLSTTLAAPQVLT